MTPPSRTPLSRRAARALVPALVLAATAVAAPAAEAAEAASPPATSPFPYPQ